MLGDPILHVDFLAADPRERSDDAQLTAKGGLHLVQFLLVDEILSWGSAPEEQDHLANFLADEAQLAALGDEGAERGQPRAGGDHDERAFAHEREFEAAAAEVGVDFAAGQAGVGTGEGVGEAVGVGGRGEGCGEGEEVVGCEAMNGLGWVRRERGGGDEDGDGWFAWGEDTAGGDGVVAGLDWGERLDEIGEWEGSPRGIRAGELQKPTKGEVGVVEEAGVGCLVLPELEKEVLGCWRGGELGESEESVAVDRGTDLQVVAEEGNGGCRSGHFHFSCWVERCDADGYLVAGRRKSQSVEEDVHFGIWIARPDGQMITGLVCKFRLTVEIELDVKTVAIGGGEEFPIAADVDCPYGRALSSGFERVTAVVRFSMVKVDGLQRLVFLDGQRRHILDLAFLKTQLLFERGKQILLPAHEILLCCALSIVRLADGHQRLSPKSIQSVHDDVHDAIVELVVAVAQTESSIAEVGQGDVLGLVNPIPELGGVVAGITLTVGRENEDRQVGVWDHTDRVRIVIGQVGCHGLLTEP